MWCLLGSRCERDVTVMKCNWRRVLWRDLLKEFSWMTAGHEVFSNVLLIRQALVLTEEPVQRERAVGNSELRGALWVKMPSEPRYRT